jgi:hypothetical protein
MSLIPEVWTRFVIIVDSRPAISPSAILSLLSWSRNLPLNVTITRRDFNHPVDSQHERMQVISIMKTLINPHIHRFQALHFDVMFSSSLPPFHNGFRGIASILETLWLECREDNGSSADDWDSVTSTEQQYPALTQLIIDGRNHYKACKGDPHFTVKLPEIGCLTFSHYKPLPGESFLVSDFLRPIANIDYLAFLGVIDLILEPSPLLLPTLAVMFILPELQLKNIHNSQSLTEILGFLATTSEITITHSAIGDAGPFNSEGSLTLEDIDADQDLVPLLRSWGGRSLAVKGCPSFTDTVINMMTREDGTRNCARVMTKLSISDCPNFSVAALKQLVNAEWHADDGLAIDSLLVSGRAPFFSAEDCQWLSQFVFEFDYSPTTI